MALAIEVRSFFRLFSSKKETVALSGIDLRVKGAEPFGLFGPNGRARPFIPLRRPPGPEGRQD